MSYMYYIYEKYYILLFIYWEVLKTITNVYKFARNYLLPCMYYLSPQQVCNVYTETHYMYKSSSVLGIKVLSK